MLWKDKRQQSSKLDMTFYRHGSQGRDTVAAPAPPSPTWGTPYCYRSRPKTGTGRRHTVRVSVRAYSPSL